MGKFFFGEYFWKNFGDFGLCYNLLEVYVAGNFQNQLIAKYNMDKLQKQLVKLYY